MRIAKFGNYPTVKFLYINPMDFFSPDLPKNATIEKITIKEVKKRVKQGIYHKSVLKGLAA